MDDDEITHWLELPAGMGFVPFSELAHLIAKARFPVAPEDEDYDFAYGCARVNLDEELPKAVAAGLLKVRDPLTHGPHTFPHGFALQTAVVKVSDLRAYLADRGMGVRFASAPLGEAVPTAALVAEPHEAPPLEDWKMRVQAEAAAYWLHLRKTGANPTKASIRPHLLKWCQENNVLTKIGINPSDGYLKTHVLGKWEPPR